jgi:heme exporter protein C
MIKNFFPNKIISFNNRFINFLSIICILIFFSGLVYALIISPSDYVQGDSVRIMYIHVPSSFIALGCYGVIGLSSILNLVFKIKFVSLISKSLVTLGFVFCTISILTGSLWGKPTWGVWWAWDARLFSMGILFIFYLTHVLIWKFIKNFEKASKINSLVGLVGIFNLPVIRYSVEWWNTLHQPSSITLTSAPTIHYSMLLPLLIMFAGMLMYSLIIFLKSYKIEVMKFKIKKKNNLFN